MYDHSQVCGGYDFNNVSYAHQGYIFYLTFYLWWIESSKEQHFFQIFNIFFLGKTYLLLINWKHY